VQTRRRVVHRGWSHLDKTLRPAYVVDSLIKRRLKRKADAERMKGRVVIRRNRDSVLP